MRVHEIIFLYSIYLTYILTFLIILGLSTLAPIYLKYLKTFLQVYIGLILVFFYNPISYNKDKKFTEFDRKLIFTSGTFLLLSSVLITYVDDYLGISYMKPFGENIRNILKI